MDRGDGAGGDALVAAEGAQDVTGGVRFYLDADLSPRIAVIARSLGLDVVSAHEAGLAEAEDADQLRHAAAEGRVLVTRNRDDFLALTLEAYHDRAPHAGLLLLARAGRAHQASRLAHALRRWAAAHDPPQPYTVDWLDDRVEAPRDRLAASSLASRLSVSRPADSGRSTRGSD